MTPTFALLSAGALTWAFLEERPGYPRLFGYLGIVPGLCILISVGARVYLVPPSEIALQTLYQGVLMSGVAIMTFNRAVAMLAPPRRPEILALVPVPASLLAVPVLGVIPTSTEWLAIAVIVLGVLFAARRSPQSLQLASPKR